jgi:hypothetical protein
MQYIRLQHVKGVYPPFLTYLAHRTHDELPIGDIEEMLDRLPINHKITIR